MVKYRLGYDYVFIPNEPIIYKEEDISGSVAKFEKTSTCLQNTVVV
ncbi:hypothetical protein Q8G37_25940 [Bacillus wiedmannii]|nr:hypothetical protein [Bacillus wiedmannii]MDP1459839.1 hypothetical protein [Bacillus wiedmannii]